MPVPAWASAALSRSGQYAVSLSQHTSPSERTPWTKTTAVPLVEGCMPAGRVVLMRESIHRGRAGGRSVWCGRVIRRQTFGFRARERASCFPLRAPDWRKRLATASTRTPTRRADARQVSLVVIQHRTFVGHDANRTVWKRELVFDVEHRHVWVVKPE